MRTGVLFLLLIALCAAGQDNPFLTVGGEPQSTQQGEPSFLRSLSWRSAGLQNDMLTAIAETQESMERGNLSDSLLLMLGVSFLYGLVHALGPGHR